MLSTFYQASCDNCFQIYNIRPTPNSLTRAGRYGIYHDHLSKHHSSRSLSSTSNTQIFSGLIHFSVTVDKFSLKCHAYLTQLYQPSPRPVQLMGDTTWLLSCSINPEPSSVAMMSSCCKNFSVSPLFPCGAVTPQGALFPWRHHQRPPVSWASRSTVRSLQPPPAPGPP